MISSLRILFFLQVTPLLVLEGRIVKEAATREKPGYRYYLTSTVNAAIRRDVWTATRFPEELKVFEDLGIAKRILDAGWKIIYEPRASVYHSHAHTTAGLSKGYFDIGYTLRQLEIWNGKITRLPLMGWMEVVAGEVRSV